MNPKYKKIGEAEMIIGSVFFFGLYLMSDLLDGLIIGAFLVPLINLFCTGINWWFFTSKGDVKASNLQSLIVQSIGGAIPFVPAPLIAFGVKTYIHNHPKMAISPAKNPTAAATKA